MCGRYITPNQAALEREWGQLPGDVEYFPSYNFAPTMRGPVVVDTDEDPDKFKQRDRAVRLMTWGFQPHWAKRSWINARAETVFQNRAFARDARSHRCLDRQRGEIEAAEDHDGFVAQVDAVIAAGKGRSSTH